MYIYKVRIEGYRLFRDTTVELQPKVNVVIGRNNSGKTALLKALRLVLPGSGPEPITVDDFHRALPEDRTPPSIGVSITFKSSGDGTDSMAEKGLVATWLTRIAAPWEAQLTFSCFLPDEHHAEFAEASGSDSAQYWRAVGDFMPKFVRRVHAGDPSASVPADPEYLAKLDMEFLDAIRDVESRMLTGRSPLLRSMLRQALDHSAIPSARRTNRIEFSEQAAQLLEKLKPRLSKDVLFDLVGKTGASAGGAPDLDGELREEDLLAALRLVVDGPEGRLPVTHNGLGYNNLLYVSLILASLRFQSHRYVGRNAKVFALLAIEEPEAHLHPALQHHLMKFVAERLDQDEPSKQAIVTSHSTHVTAAAGLDSLICLTEDEHHRPKITYPARVYDFENGAASKHYVERYLDATRSNLLFADAVLLVEGPSEQLLLPDLAQLLEPPRSLVSSHVAVVSVGGSTFKHFLPLFGARPCGSVDLGGLDTKVACLVDADPSRRRKQPTGARFRRCWPYQALDGHDESYEVRPLSEVAAALKIQCEGRPGIEVFWGRCTLEYDLAWDNLGSEVLITGACTHTAALRQIASAPGSGVSVADDWLDADDDVSILTDRTADTEEIRKTVFAICYQKAIGGRKGEHAYQLSTALRQNANSGPATKGVLVVPDHIRRAIEWVCPGDHGGAGSGTTDTAR